MEESIVPIPENITLLHEMDGITLRRRWRSGAAWFLLFFCLFWDGFMVVWFSIALTQGQWAMAAFGTLHGLVGVGITYLMLAMFLNSTDIRITPSILTVRHYPLPWPGAKQFDTSDIQQLYCKERERGTRNGNRQVAYDLHLIDRTGKQHKFLSGLDTSEQALYLEQQIESVLGVEDQAVRGEIAR